MTVYLVDVSMVLLSLVFNVVLIMVFVSRGRDYLRLETGLGVVSNLLLIPFLALWLLNFVGGGDLGRLVTPLPVIAFLFYDLWYRSIAKRKPRYHPANWPTGLYVYLLLYLVGGIMLNGYAFLVSLPLGFVVLASYYGSLMAYGYSQYKIKKKQKGSHVAV